jgi:hypothetical protein
MIDLTFSVAANDSACFVYFGTGGVCGVAQLLWDTSIEATVKLILNEDSYSQEWEKKLRGFDARVIRDRNRCKERSVF